MGSLVAEALGEDVHVSTSHETAGVFREYERCVTTIVDAAVSPLLRGYLSRLTERASAAGLPEPEVMLSSGGTASAETAARHGSWTVLSGPAGGAVGAARVAEQAGGGRGRRGGREDASARSPEGGSDRASRGAPGGGRSAAVGLDMGGTSCDVSLAIGGAAAVGHGREIGGRALALPMVDVHTVGAGGGSIAWRDAGGALRVGPRSAGAEPGPACYGRGGTEPTVTDADLLLGWLDADSPLAGGVRLDRDAAERAVEGLASELGLTAGAGGGRHREGREHGDGAGRAGRDGGARHRPPRDVPGGLRRGGAAARRADRGRAGHAPRDRADRVRGAVGAGTRGLGAPARRGGERPARRGGAHA